MVLSIEELREALKANPELLKEAKVVVSTIEADARAKAKAEAERVKAEHDARITRLNEVMADAQKPLEAQFRKYQDVLAESGFDGIYVGMYKVEGEPDVFSVKPTNYRVHTTKAPKAEGSGNGGSVKTLEVFGMRLLDIYNTYATSEEQQAHADAAERRAGEASDKEGRLRQDAVRKRVRARAEKEGLIHRLT